MIAAVAGLSRVFMHNLCTFKVEGAEALHAALDRPPGQVAFPCLSSACVLRTALRCLLFTVLGMQGPSIVCV